MSPIVAARSAASPGRRSLRFYLVALVLVASLPAFAAAALAVWRAASAYRDASATRLLDTASTLARAVESELERSAAVLRTLAAVPGPGGRIALGEWIERMSAQLQGRIVFVDGRPPALAGAVQDVVRQALGDGGPGLSNLYRESDGGEPRVALAVARPASAGALVLETSPRQLVRTLQQGVTQGLLVAVTDGSGRVVARSLDPERHVGSEVPDWALLQAVGRDRGLFTARTLEGRPIMFGFEKLRGTPGWVVVVGEPFEAFAARWQQPLIGVALGGLAALALALAGAGWVGRLVLHPVAALARRAEAIGADRDLGTAAPPDASPVAEFESLRASLAAAERALRERAEAERRIARELAERERRHRTLVEAGALTQWRCDSDGAMTAADGWQDLTGQRPEQWAQFGWLDRVPAGDREALRQSWRAAVQERRLVDVEFRVLAADGQARWVRARGAPVFGDDGRLIEWVGTMEDVDERRRAQARVAHMAHHDALTGLPNRVRFREALEAAIARAGRGDAGALLCIDLDRFKDVNDSLGHPVGDALLVAAAHRLTGLVRGTDLVARLGGDEFAIVQSEVHGPNDAAILAGRILDALARPHRIDAQQIVCGASVGVVMIGHAQPDADALMRNADMALYRAKESGRGRCSFFEPAMDERMRRRRELELELRSALEEGQFELHYQPLVSLPQRRVCGFEALLRWHHPRRGLVLPDDFVPLAEEIGLIVPLGAWVLRRACRDAAGWEPRLRVAVNVAAAQLARREFVADVEAALREAGLPARRLELEVSERSVLAEGEPAIETLREVKRLGVSVAMDDFGTGHSSLGCLSSVPFDRLKIDRSFVAGLGARRDADAIVRAVARLAEGLGLTTTAEGVETEAQLDRLVQERCSEVQGHWLGAAQPAHRLGDWLREAAT